MSELPSGAAQRGPSAAAGEELFTPPESEGWGQKPCTLLVLRGSLRLILVHQGVRAEAEMPCMVGTGKLIGRAGGGGVWCQGLVCKLNVGIPTGA